MQHHHHHTDHHVASMMAMGGADDDSSSHHLLCGYNDSGMIMYMDGFQWTLKGKGSCLNFFVESWKLDTVSRFVASMVFVVAMGIATEGINRWKHNVAQKLKRNVTNNNHNKLRGMHTCLQGMSILSAYLLMLVVMTYSLELLLCVILGLMVGYFIFDGDSFHHGGGTPCCNFNVMDGTEAGSTTTTSMITEPLLPRTTSLGGSSDSNNNNNNGNNSHRPATTLSDGTMESFEHSCCNNNDGSGSQNDEEEI